MIAKDTVKLETQHEEGQQWIEDANVNIHSLSHIHCTAQLKQDSW
jgi:hypothetical protein